MEIISLLVLVILIGGIVIILQKGFSEIVKGLQSIDERLKRLEDLKNKGK